MRDLSTLRDEERFAAAEELESVIDSAAADSYDLSSLTQRLLIDFVDDLRLAGVSPARER